MQSQSVLASINLGALIHNINELKKINANATIISMVKANAYGHGLGGVSRGIESYVDYFGVASIDEGILIRKLGINKKIIIFSGFFEPSQVAFLNEYKLIPMLHSKYQLTMLGNFFQETVTEIWLKVNTGMNRLGFEPDDFDEIYGVISSKYTKCDIGVITHFAESEVISSLFTKKQISRFSNIIEGKNLTYIGANNSAGILNNLCCDICCNIIRPGISLFGVSNVSIKHTLMPVMTLKAYVIAINYIKKGESIGYNCAYIASKNMKIAVISIGYGDGYPYCAPVNTPVLIRNHRCALVGKVSMDMITVDITDYNDITEQDVVTLWGDKLRVEEIAKFIGTSPYALLSGVADRVRREYIN